MRSILIGLVMAAGLSLPASAQQLLKNEPPRGGLRQGQEVLVDNGKCPKGQVQKVTGGYFVGGKNSVTSGGQGNTRQYACVPRP